MNHERILPVSLRHPMHGTKVFKLSEDTHNAINDLVQAAFEFTLATEKTDVEDKYACLQQRKLELIERISPLEVAARIARPIIVRF